MITEIDHRNLSYQSAIEKKYKATKKYKRPIWKDWSIQTLDDQLIRWSVTSSAFAIPA